MEPGVRILATKLYLPLPRPQIVSRSRLLERLDEGLQRKLTLVSAPAGFGKTTLVSEWLAACQRRTPAARTAWLSLDEGDSHPPRFLAYLIAALQTVDGALGAGALGMLQAAPPPPNEAILTALLNDLAALGNALDALPQDLILVLDDYHQVDAAQVDQALAFLLEHLPPQMHLLIASREDPQLPLARLRARGQLSELRAADLRFTPAEAAEFLNRASGLQGMGLTLSAKEISALEARTEGWIAGLQLAALALQGSIGPQGRSDPASFIQAFTGSHRFVLDYLVEEVLQRQPQHVRNFLLQTAILERLSAPLCAAVTGQADSRSILESLERGNLFVIPLDDQRQWYRYHHLFAEVLQTYLAEPEQVSALHRRASAWFEHNDLPAEAIRHALAGKDFARAASLLELAHPAMDVSYQSAAWLAWARALPEALLRARPVLSVDYAWALLDSGEMEASQARLQDAERCLAGQAGLSPVVADEAQLRALPASIASARAYRALALGDVPGAVQHAQQALELAPPGDLLHYIQATSLLGVAQYTRGDLPAAERALASFYAELCKTGDVLTLTGITFLLADIRVGLGRLGEAERTYQQALRLATGQGERTNFPVGTSDLYRGLAELACERGELEAAAGYLHTARNLGEQAALTGWPQRLLSAQARLQQAQGDLDGALALLDQAERAYVRAPLPNARPAAASKAHIWIRQGRLAEAQEWAREHNLSPDDELSYLDEFEHLTLARLLTAQSQRDQESGALQSALGLLERLLQAAQAGERMGSLVEILAAQALAHQAQGELPLALAALGRALALAEPEGYLQTFVNEGPPWRRCCTRRPDGASPQNTLGGCGQPLRRTRTANPPPSP
ncbi:MAG: AAA family ATPase [Chloroflexota bacterium]